MAGMEGNSTIPGESVREAVQDSGGVCEGD